MAYCDYIHCVACDCKVLYDANIDYPEDLKSSPVILCNDCLENWEIIVRNKTTKKEIKP